MLLKTWDYVSVCKLFPPSFICFKVKSACLFYRGGVTRASYLHGSFYSSYLGHLYHRVWIKLWRPVLNSASRWLTLWRNAFKIILENEMYLEFKIEKDTSIKMLLTHPSFFSNSYFYTFSLSSLFSYHFFRHLIIFLLWFLFLILHSLLFLKKLFLFFNFSFSFRVVFLFSVCLPLSTFPPT